MQHMVRVDALNGRDVVLTARPDPDRLAHN
jgi:hypothetical protein